MTTKICIECGREFIPREPFFKKCFQCATGKRDYTKSERELLNTDEQIVSHDEYWKGMF